MSARGGKRSAFSASASHRASFGSHKASTAAVDAVKLNPFERLKQRAKFDVMGRTLKGTQRANGQARSRAIQKRKESLLVELQQDGKRNQFIDHRFGEGDDTITADDRMLQRFQKERQTKSKKFNLDEDGTELTHMGTALSQLDDDDLHGSDESEGDDEDSGQLSAAQVAAHFGGPDSKNVYAAYQTDPNRARTKEEIMKEVISKSKFHKLERQQDKADTDTLVNTLDEQFADIRRMMEYRPTKAEAPAAAVVQDDYDKRARELLFDPKVRATDRTKTDEEMAKLEFERLQKAEQQRLRRMKGEESEEEEEDEDAKRKSKKRKERATDDDLDEDFHTPDVVPDVDWDKILDEKNAQESDEGSDDGSDDGSEDDEEEDNGSDLDDEGGTFDFEEEEEGGDNEDEDDDDEAEEASDDEMPTKQKGKNNAKSAKDSFDPETKRQRMKEAANTIPFVIAAPAELEDLLELFKDRSVEDRVTIIQRIRTCNHISLGEANRAKLQRFFCMLFDYFENLCDSFTPSDINNPSSDAADPNSFAFLMKSLDSLCPHLYEMSDAQAGLAGKLTRARLSAAQRFVFDTLAATSKSESNTDSEHIASLVSCFPSATALFMLKLTGQLFSVSDARHPVVTPSMLFISQCLAQVPVRGGRCLTAALFLCNTLLSYIIDSKRFIPELIAALTSIVLHQFESAKQTDASELRGLWSKLAAKELVASKLNVQALFLDNDDEYFRSSQFACASLQATLQLISQTANAYAQVASFPELFQPVLDVLNASLTTFGTKHADKSLLVQLQSVCTSLQQRISSCLSLRRPLTMRTFRAVPIRSMAPKFDEDYRPGKDTDPDRDRAEAKQMKKKLKQEKRGAMRELRKDAAFMALEHRKQQQIDASDKEKKLKATRTWLQQQASDYNGGAQSKKLKTKK